MSKILFDSERQPGERKPRGRDKRTIVLEALQLELGDDCVDPEKEFYQLCVKRSLTTRDPASTMITKELLARLYPIPKPVMPSSKFEYPENASPSEKIEAIGNAIATGEIPADLGKMMVDIIMAGVKIFEVTELAERLARIEEMLTSGSAATP